MESVKDFFIMTTEEQRKFKLGTQRQTCPDCLGDGVCHQCHGEYKSVCLYCDGGYETDRCDNCDSGETAGDFIECDCCANGKCEACGGLGERMLNETELRQAGFTKAAARKAVNG